MTFKAGDLVDWRHEPRGGWGFEIWVPSQVVKVGKKRITIAAQLRNGGEKQVSVSPERLRPRNPHGLKV